MTFSFNPVFELFLLAPGFAVFAGLYHGSQIGPVRSPPPPPGSILALTIVTLGSLVAHFVAASAFLLQDVLCARVKCCLVVGFDPNAYVALSDIAGTKSIRGPDVVVILGALIATSLAAFCATRCLIRQPSVAASLKGILYGWLGEIVVASGKNDAVLAYVLSDVQEDGTIVGYEGVVANMTTNADKEVTSVLMTSCETFYLRVTADGVIRQKAERASPIPQLYLDQSRIKNIAFEPVRFQD